MIRKLLCGAVFMGSAAAWATAALPETTTIVDGEFAPGTVWYTMQIHTSGYYLSNELNANGAMPTSRTTTDYDFGDMWCFTGNNTDGYTIYNRAEGTSKSLAAPTTMSGTTGANSYPTLKEPGVSGECYLWILTTGSISGSYFIAEKGYSSNRINVRDGQLAFWTQGADNGSSVVITPVPTMPGMVDGVLVVNEDPLTTLSGEIAPTENADGTISLGDCLYSFTTPEGQVVRSWSITFADGTNKSMRGRGESNDQMAIQGPLENIDNIVVDVLPELAMAETGYAVFRYDGTTGFTIQYRIPAIASIPAGPHKNRLFAVNDYRYCGADIGAGRIDLYQSYSDDFGATWTTPDVMRGADGTPVAQGTGAATPSGTKQSVTNLDCGFGDPAVVADRESGDLLVVSCSGRMGFFASRRDDPQPSARWWSTDGGETWTEPDFTQWEQIYSLFDDNCTYGYIDSQFIGSGKMVQSSRIKVGTHYRLYAVMSGRHAESGNLSNWVLYSDDFGHNWHILGDPYNPAVSAGADEPKCEELPDGSILLAARGNGGGRNFNIFKYTNIENAEGRWDTHINSTLGTGHGINACNGEILIVPAKNVTTGEQAYLALQSFTNSSSREKVSIAWKVLASISDYDEPSDFNNWNGYYQLTSLSSAYSTMTLQCDNKVGALWEEGTFGGYAYSEVYRALSIEEITDGAWTYQEDTDGTVGRAHAAESVSNRAAKVAAEDENIVGYHTAEGKALVQEAAEAYAADPCDDTWTAFNAAYFSNLLQPVSGGIYSFKSAHGGKYSISGDRWLSAGTSNDGVLTVKASEDETTRFLVFNHVDSVSHFALYNESLKRYAQATPSTVETSISTAEKSYDAGLYNFNVSNGVVAIVCQNPGNTGYPAIHMNSSLKPVIWTTSEAASLWVMTLLGTTDELPEADELPGEEEETPDPGEMDGIAEISADNALTAGRLYDLSGREVIKPRAGQIIITEDRRKVVAQ